MDMDDFTDEDLKKWILLLASLKKKRGGTPASDFYSIKNKKYDVELPRIDKILEQYKKDGLLEVNKRPDFFDAIVFDN